MDSSWAELESKAISRMPTCECVLQLYTKDLLTLKTTLTAPNTFSSKHAIITNEPTEPANDSLWLQVRSLVGRERHRLQDSLV